MGLNESPTEASYTKREGREICEGEGTSQMGESLVNPEGSKDEAENSLWRIGSVSSLSSLCTRGKR